MSNQLSNHIKTQSFLTLGSLINLAAQNNLQSDKSLDLLLNQNKQVTRDYNAKLTYLEALKNTKNEKCFKYVSKIEDFKNSAKLSLSILKYLDSLSPNLLDINLLKDLIIIFDDKKLREELRIEALNVILNKYTELLANNDSPLLENILRVLFIENSKTTKEFKFFCQQLIWNKIQTNQQFRFT